MAVSFYTHGIIAGRVCNMTGHEVLAPLAIYTLDGLFPLRERYTIGMPLRRARSCGESKSSRGPLATMPSGLIWRWLTM